MRYLALRDLNEFIGAFAATNKERAGLRPWVASSIRAAMRHNQLEQAWDNSITFWDAQQPPMLVDEPGTGRKLLLHVSDVMRRGDELPRVPLTGSTCRAGSTASPA